MLMVAVYLFLIAKLLPEPLQFILGELRSKNVPALMRAPGVLPPP
jgi:hypothetical protein